VITASAVFGRCLRNDHAVGDPHAARRSAPFGYLRRCWSRRHIVHRSSPALIGTHSSLVPI